LRVKTYPVGEGLVGAVHVSWTVVVVVEGAVKAAGALTAVALLLPGPLAPLFQLAFASTVPRNRNATSALRKSDLLMLVTRRLRR
jgi:hypothetical protein